MSETKSNRHQTIVVTGDVTLGWNIASAARSGRSALSWRNPSSATRAYWQRGGAALLADLIESVAARIQQPSDQHVRVLQNGAPTEPVTPNDSRFGQSYKQWQAFPATTDTTAQHVWRMVEWLGRSPAAAEDTPQWAHVVDDDPNVELVLLSDSNLGFRDQPALWPQALDKALTSGDAPPWIILKMVQPVAEGALWEHLHTHYADRLIIITTIDDVRQSEAQISRELSWERTAQDLTWELVYNPYINSLTRCAHVVVSFGAAGAMLLSRADHTVRGRLFFDPNVVEGMWEMQRPGYVTGYTTCLAAAIAERILANAQEPDMEQALQNGLTALRTLHQEGYGTVRTDSSDPVAFPHARIVDVIQKQAAHFSITPVRDPGGLLHPSGDRTRGNAQWTILEECYSGELNRVAQDIVLHGARHALDGVPLGQFGALLTVDRREIESYRSVGALVSEYSRQPGTKRPLSIAVFGSPGSGKSFGVTQLAGALLPGQIEKLEFNLSQFESAHQLLDAFHRVRDTALAGKIPLVFWDEFDTALDNQPLGWLRHFLAPMQDGAFQEGQISHPLGRAIFVFAGGTCESMSQFDRGLADDAFRSAKGPDFVSRLKGFIDVTGPNPKEGDGESDRYYIIRRAILLRFLLQSNAPQIFRREGNEQIPQIDSGVLRAFLEIPRYHHGARSMENVVATSALAGNDRFERSALPTESILNLHVDGRRFLSLVQRLELSGPLLERLAAAAFDVYAASARQQAVESVTADVAYADLTDAEREQNRMIVRDIPVKLAEAGYVMRPARGGEHGSGFPPADRERLAELEHERWLRARLESGWRYGAETVRNEKIHAALLPWDELSSAECAERYPNFQDEALGLGALPESEKEKNRALIDGIPKILARAGYTLVKVREDDAGG